MIRAKSQRVYQTADVMLRRRICAKKLIRAAHAKEKQLLEELVPPPESP